MSFTDLSHFITGVMCDFDGRTIEGIAILEELIRREKPELCGTCSPTAAFSAFHGNSRMIAAYKISGKKPPRIIGWLQLTKTDVVFSNAPQVEVRRYWLEDRYLNTNVMQKMLVTTKRFAASTWRADSLRLFTDQPAIDEHIRYLGGITWQTNANRWEGYLATQWHAYDATSTLPPPPADLLSAVLRTKERWRLTQCVPSQSKPPAPTDYGSSSIS
ncbi:TPA: hypothetical protein DEP96_00935 [Candidatus Uhrbacteria bacterium]|nr:hypothetical protein [Candidatus Uhrbacteria bacterium]